MTTLNDTLTNWATLSQQAAAPFVQLAKGYEELGQTLAKDQTARLEAVLTEARKTGETLEGATSIATVLSAQRGMLTAWNELLTQQTENFGQQATQAANNLTQLHEDAGRDVLDVLAKATDQVIADTGQAVDQYLNQVEVVLNWMLKLATQPKTA